MDKDYTEYPVGSPLGEVFNAILHHNAVEPVDGADETRQLVVSAMHGDGAATRRLLTAVGGTVRKLRGKFRRMPREEFDSAVCLSLFEAMRDFDLDAGKNTGGLGVMVYQRATKALAPVTSSTITVPSRTVQRYYAIERAAMKEAEAQGILDHTCIAVRIAGEFNMTAECYLDVRNAISSCTMSDIRGALEDSDVDAEWVIEEAVARFIDPGVAEENAALTELAFEAVDELEAAVCYVAYGFGKERHPKADDNARSDAEVGERLGLSNSKAHRTRRKALDKMHAALMPDD